MKEEPRFYLFKESGLVVEALCGKEAPLGPDKKPMEELRAHHSEGAAEKHLPIVKRNGREVTVKAGSVLHPMMDVHHIYFICLETEKGLQRQNLSAEQEPSAVFALADGDEPVAAYAYCNLHGLWKTLF